VRDLFGLMIFEQLMEAVDPDAPSKPCDYFEMIGRTSTGGWMVVTGRQAARADRTVSSPLWTSVAKCIRAYLSPPQADLPQEAVPGDGGRRSTRLV
jgi:hypothetical protein